MRAPMGWVVTARAFVSIEPHPHRDGYELVTGGPSEPLLVAAGIAGVMCRWDRAAHGWAVRTEHLADLVAAGEHARLIYVRSAP